MGSTSFKRSTAGQLSERLTKAESRASNIPQVWVTTALFGWASTRAAGDGLPYSIGRVDPSQQCRAAFVQVWKSVRDSFSWGCDWKNSGKYRGESTKRRSRRTVIRTEERESTSCMAVSTAASREVARPEIINARRRREGIYATQSGDPLERRGYLDDKIYRDQIKRLQVRGAMQESDQDLVWRTISCSLLQANSN
ncbi:hypothetical protein JB92DRAFT_3096487, partial [Gautieria morchelliformis]